MLFRWSIWGEKKQNLEMLLYSISSFRIYFGNSARYVVYTDEPSEVSNRLGCTTEVYSYNTHSSRCFDISSIATWRKWCPVVRLVPGKIEFYVDSDIFIVGQPNEILGFCAGVSGNRFMTMQESIAARWCFGRFDSRVSICSPPINAGLIGQQPQADLTFNLLNEFRWWQENITPEEATFHDEQGAVVAALFPYITEGLVDLLSTERYRIVSPRSNSDLNELSNVALIHTTYPDHPGFHKFRTLLDMHNKNL